MVSEIARKADPNINTELISAQANRYNSLETYGSAPDHNFQNTGITVLKVPQHHGTLVGQIICFFIFAKKTLKHLKCQAQEIDLVIATSSRLMTACLGAFIACRYKAKLHLDIRDLFIINIQNILGMIPRVCIMALLKKIEQLTLTRANSISVVSPAFIPHIQKVSSKAPIWIATNGIDPQFVNLCQTKKERTGTPTVLYAGNIGDGQALHKILPIVAKNLNGNVKFKVIGDGTEKWRLESELKNLNISNVELLPPISRDKLMCEYKRADILFLHLNDHKALNLVIPSKIFEYVATGKPILAGVSGFSAELLEEVAGVEKFTPCNARQMKIALSTLLQGPSSFERNEFCKKFDRSEIMADLIEKIITETKARAF